MLRIDEDLKSENLEVVKKDLEYVNWLASLKTRVQRAQLKAAVAVNQELLQFYWELGNDIIGKQKDAAWGSGFVKQLSHDLMTEFPEIKGFSEANLRFIKRWVLFYNPAISNSVTACDRNSEVIEIQDECSGHQQIIQIPWGHNRVIITKCSDVREALYYVNQVIKHGWSRSVLTHQIEGQLWKREGYAISNFISTLPEPDSDLAQQTLKDPYIFDFLTLTANHNERDLENQLTEHITKFLLELGAGFAYLGRQVPLKVGEREFFIDLLFYHAQLHCYVVLELKTGDFEPEYAGKLNFYIKAVDEQLRSKRDSPTIGILLCKKRDKFVAEYALSDIHKPIGISEYQLTQSLPDSLKANLPDIEEIEAEFQ